MCHRINSTVFVSFVFTGSCIIRPGIKELWYLFVTGKGYTLPCLTSHLVSLLSGCRWFNLCVDFNFFFKGKQSKGKFLYSAISSPQDRSKRFTLYFPDRPVHSDTISASLGSVQPYAAINARWLLVHISTTVYSQVLI